MRFGLKIGSMFFLALGVSACGNGDSTGPSSRPPQPTETLHLDVSALPEGGAAQLRGVELIADVVVEGSAARGNLTYTFDCDVTDGRTDHADISPATRFGSGPLCDYPDVDTYTYEVCVSRAGASCATGTVETTDPPPLGQRSESDRPDSPTQADQPIMHLYYVCPKDPGRCRNFDTDGTIQGWVDAGQTWFQNHAGTTVRIDGDNGIYDITFVQLDVLDEAVVNQEGSAARTLITLTHLLEQRGFRYSHKVGYIFYEGGAVNHCGSAARNLGSGWAISFLRSAQGTVRCGSQQRATSTSEPLVPASWLFIHETGHLAGLGHYPQNHRDFMYACDDGSGCDGPADRGWPLFDPENIYRDIFFDWRYLNSN